MRLGKDRPRADFIVQSANFVFFSLLADYCSMGGRSSSKQLKLLVHIQNRARLVVSVAGFINLKTVTPMTSI